MQRNPLETILDTDSICNLLIQRKKQRENPEEMAPIVSHSEEDVKELEEFCRSHGIIGFGCGTMSPKSALRMLKSKMGILDKENYNISTKKNLLLD